MHLHNVIVDMSIKPIGGAGRMATAHNNPHKHLQRGCDCIASPFPSKYPRECLGRCLAYMQQIQFAILPPYVLREFG